MTVPPNDPLLSPHYSPFLFLFDFLHSSIHGIMVSCMTFVRLSSLYFYDNFHGPTPLRSILSLLGLVELKIQFNDATEGCVCFLYKKGVGVECDWSPGWHKKKNNGGFTKSLASPSFSQSTLSLLNKLFRARNKGRNTTLQGRVW